MKTKKLKTIISMMFILILLTSMIPSHVFAYESDLSMSYLNTFGGDHDDYFEGGIKTSDGNILAVGYSDSDDEFLHNKNKGSRDAIIVKYTLDGNILWFDNFGGSSYDRYQSVIEVSDGYIALGNTNSQDIDLNGINTSVGTIGLAVKYDFNGNIVWKKVYSEMDYIRGVKKIENDSFIIVGSKYIDPNRNQAKILKLNSSGSVIMNRTFGGSNNDYFNSISKTSNGLIVLGETWSNDGDLTGLSRYGMTDALLVKYDSNLNIISKDTFGGTDYDYFYDALSVTDNRIVLVGKTQSEDYDLDELSGRYMGFIVEYDLNSKIFTLKEYIDSSSFDTGFYEIQKNNDSYIVAGSDGRAIIREYDLDFNFITEHMFYGWGTDIIKNIFNTDDGFIVTGSSDSDNKDFTVSSLRNWNGFIARFGKSSLEQLIDDAINNPTQENIDNVWQGIFELEDPVEKELKFNEFLTNDTVFESAYNQVELAKETKARQDIIDAIEKTEDVSDNNPYKSLLEIDNAELKHNFNQMIKYGDVDKLSQYYVDKAEAFSTVYYVKRANYFVHVLEDSPAKTELINRVNVIAEKMFNKVDRFALEIATKYVEYAESYKAQELIDKATALVNQLENSTQKTNLLNRLAQL